MKKFRLLFLIGTVLLAGGQSLFAQSKKEKSEQKEKEVKEVIESKQFTINVDRALPMGGRSVNLTTSYSLEMRGDSAISYLPYFGRAYTAPYGGGNGMRFEKEVADYQCTYNKKGVAKIQFVARTDEDTYRFAIQVYPNGSASINVTPVNKQSITYQGELVSGKAK